MRIGSIALTHVRIPLAVPLRNGGGVCTDKHSVLVTVDVDGMTGVGEASPGFGVTGTGDSVEAVWVDLRQRLIPALVSMRPRTLDDVCGVLEAIGGTPSGRAGVETAFWDAEAQRAGMPLGRFLGGARSRVECGLVVGGTPTIAELIGLIERHLSAGYKRVKISVHPGWDIEPVLAVRRQFGDIPLMVDADGTYVREQFDHLRRFDEFDLVMIEQPLSGQDIEGHALLQGLLRTPVCLGEGIEDLSTLERAIELGACRVVSINIQRVGGLRNAKRIHDYCAGAGVPVWAGSTAELGVGSGHTVHLATLANFRFPADVQASHQMFVDDILSSPLEVCDGEIQIPLAPGSAFQVSAKAVEKYTVRREVVVTP
jgi:o-succinylbenzoate synthase